MHSHDDFDSFFTSSHIAAGSSEAATAGPVPLPPRLGLLAALSGDEFDVIARSARLAVVPAGRVIFRQGEEAHRFFIVIDGEVQVTRDGKLLAKLGPECFFGESALLVGGNRSATVITSKDSSLWSVDYDAFKSVVETHLLDNDDVAREIHERLQATDAHDFD